MQVFDLGLVELVLVGICFDNVQILMCNVGVLIQGCGGYVVFQFCGSRFCVNCCRVIICVNEMCVVLVLCSFEMFVCCMFVMILVVDVVGVVGYWIQFLDDVDWLKV